MLSGDNKHKELGVKLPSSQADKAGGDKIKEGCLNHLSRAPKGDGGKNKEGLNSLSPNG